MTANMQTGIRRAFDESIAAKRQFLEENLESLGEVVDLLAARMVAGSKLLLFGNGGSAADCQHIAAELVNRFLLERPPLPAIALTTDTSILTSVSNDYGYADIFAKQVKALGREGDVAMAISTSGNSSNVIRAVDVCRKKGIQTIGLTGGDGGKLGGKVDIHLCVTASRATPRIQETHILVGHVICEMLDQKLFGRQTRPETARRARSE